MRVHVLQHVAFEGPGSITDWLAARQADVSFTHFHQPDARLPDLAGLDMVIAMGGPMSVNDEQELPWLVAEKAFLRAAVAQGLPVLGICLGAQLIASAHGAGVHAGRDKEIGWFPVHAEPVPDGCFAFPAAIEVFHWHGETFALPAGAVLLARSAACRHQAFQLGARAIGLQFHLETTPASAEALLLHCRAELVPAAFVQDEESIRARTAGSGCSEINRLMTAVLDYINRP